MFRLALRSPRCAPALAALIAAATGCSISYSSESLSKSVSSPFKWSSSSSGEADDPAYQEEVRSFAAGFARSGGDASAFRRGVASIAERRGIQDWEDDDQTRRAIRGGARGGSGGPGGVGGPPPPPARGARRRAPPLPRSSSFTSRRTKGARAA